MNRTSFLCISAALVAASAACSARTSLRDDGDGSQGGGGSGSVTTVTSTSNGPSATSTTGGGMCNEPPAPAQEMPTAPGCYEDIVRQGWVEVACGCELWLENTMPNQVTASIELSVTPNTPVPSLNGEPDDHMTFPDPDGSFYAVWSQQPGIGTELMVQNDGAITTLRMGVSDLKLLPVPIAACTTRKGTALVAGPAFPVLAMHATLENGTIPFATVDNTCSNPPPT